MFAGALLTYGQCEVCSQSENAWASLFTSLSSNNGITVAVIFALVMVYLVQFSGITMFIGGLLSYKNHIRSGKELVGLGTGVGLADLLLRYSTGTLAVYGSSATLAGLIVAVFASRHIHGPHATYAEEVSKLFYALKKRILRNETKTKKRIRKGLKRSELMRRGGSRRRSRRPYNIGHNEKGQGQTPRNDDTSTVTES